MWLRSGKRGRWAGRDADSPADVEEAQRDLTPRRDEELSIYCVADLAEAERVIAAHAITQTPKPDHIDAIVIPDAALVEAGVVPIPVRYDELPEYLNDRHFEAPGLQSTGVRSTLARCALLSGNVSANRVLKTRIKELYDLEVKDLPGIAGAVTERWRSYLEG